MIPNNNIKFLILKDLSLILFYRGDTERAIQVAEQAIEVANILQDKFGALEGMITILLDLNEFDRAIEVINTMHDGPENIIHRTIKYACKKILESEDIDRAIHVANMFPYTPYLTAINTDHNKSKALRDIVDTLLKSGDFLRAKEVSREIPTKYYKGIARKNIKKHEQMQNPSNECCPRQCYYPIRITMISV